MAEAIAITGSNFEPLLTAEILRAHRSIWLQTFLFDIDFERDFERRARRVAHLLADAVDDGLDVRLLLAAPGLISVAIPNRATALYCSILGIDVRLSKRENASHRKLAVFDSIRCLIGGHNITQGGLFINDDASVLVASEPIAQQAADLFSQAWDAGVSPTKPASVRLIQ